MHEGPNIARIATIIGERGRAQILTALMSGRAMTATELADAAGVTRPTASSHLSKLHQAKLIAADRQGRHRYFRIASSDVAELLEGMMGAAHQIVASPMFGPADPALRKARLCYDHLAGELGVLIYDGIERRHGFTMTTRGLVLNEGGWQLLGELGLCAGEMPQTRRPECRACIDWSERRHHLAGAIGACLLARLVELRWAQLLQGSRVVRFTAAAERSLREIFSNA
jgi:DNA-binding transcriptional ArsR family regulator